MRRLATTACCVLALGCGAGTGAPTLPGPDAAPECSVRLPALTEPPFDENPSEQRPDPPSRIVVHLEEPLSRLLAELEPRVPLRLASGRLDIGPGGTVSYEAQRGALTASVTTDALVLEAPVTARAEACRGARCYASCAPEALLRVEVPLLLRADYGFAGARVSLRFVRGCKVRALGGLLSIDVTSTLQRQLEPELSRAGREIDRQLPQLRAEVEKAYQRAAEPRLLPLLGCFVLQPEGIAQGPLTPSNSHLRARFALLARPELRPSCGPAPAPAALPPLLRDLTLTEAGVLRLGLVSELAQLERAFLAATPTSVSGRRVRVSRAVVRPNGRGVAVQLTLAGQVCGDVSFRAAPSFEGDGEHVGLASPRTSATERERLERAGLDAAALLRGLAALPRLPPPLSPRGFRESVPVLAASLPRGPVELSARVDYAKGGGATARGDELVAWLEARGAITVTR